jgi:hypothetical protein
VILDVKYEQFVGKIKILDLDESLIFWKLFCEKRAKNALSAAVSTFHR